MQFVEARRPGQAYNIQAFEEYGVNLIHQWGTAATMLLNSLSDLDLSAEGSPLNSPLTLLLPLNACW